MDKLTDTAANDAIADLEKQLKQERAARKLEMRRHMRELGWYRLALAIVCVLGIATLWLLIGQENKYLWCNEIARILNEHRQP